MLLYSSAMFKESQVTTKELLRDIKKFQNAQKRYPANSEIHAEIGKQLSPLFAEMARRQKIAA